MHVNRACVVLPPAPNLPSLDLGKGLGTIWRLWGRSWLEVALSMIEANPSVQLLDALRSRSVQGGLDLGGFDRPKHGYRRLARKK
jgi:hypothetical protein